MQLADCSPPANPTVEEQRDALTKGLGRAFQWARAGTLDQQILLEACLNNLVFDFQVDESRGGWLWQLINERGAFEAFRNPLLQALNSLSDFRDASQLCEIAVEYALTGDTDFRNVLRRIAIRQPLGEESLEDAEKAVMEFDGIEGFLKLAAEYGKRMKHRDWEWQASRLMDRAEERFGKEVVKAAISRSRHSDIVRLRRKWYRQYRASSKSQVRRNRTDEQAGADDLIAQLKTNGRGRISQWRWAREASEEELRKVAQATLAEKDRKVLARLLQVFVNRDWPEDVDRLVEFCRHENEYVSNAAWLAANRLSHPAVRALAIEGAKAGFPDPKAIGAFAANYVEGDEDLILEAIVLSEFETINHVLFLEALDVLKLNATSDLFRLALAAYRYTPCSLCRSDAVDGLVVCNLAPEWLLEECRDDANGICRRAVEPESDGDSPDPASESPT